MRQGLDPPGGWPRHTSPHRAKLRKRSRELRYVDMIYYILRKDGAYAGCSLWSTGPTGEPKTFAVHDGVNRTEKCVYLFKGTAIDWPPY